MDKSTDESVDPELPVLSSNQTEPTVNQGKINQIKLTVYFYIISHSMGTFLCSIRSISR
jgi:hypothetical protein